MGPEYYNQRRGVEKNKSSPPPSTPTPPTAFAWQRLLQKNQVQGFYAAGYLLCRAIIYGSWKTMKM